MARKTRLFTLPQSEGRDSGKCFLITEKDAVSAEKWARRALSALAKAGRNEMPEDLASGGMAALVRIGIAAVTTLDFHEAEPLMDDMLQCVTFIPDRNRIDQFTQQPLTRPVDWANDVEEVATILLLRSEVIDLHVGFSIAEFLSKLGASAKEAMANSSLTSTSPSPSETASPAA